MNLQLSLSLSLDNGEIPLDKEAFIPTAYLILLTYKGGLNSKLVVHCQRAILLSYIHWGLGFGGMAYETSILWSIITLDWSWLHSFVIVSPKNFQSSLKCWQWWTTCQSIRTSLCTVVRYFFWRLFIVYTPFICLYKNKNNKVLELAWQTECSCVSRFCCSTTLYIFCFIRPPFYILTTTLLCCISKLSSIHTKFI